MSYAPICRNCERLSGAAEVIENEPGLNAKDFPCAVCGAPTFRCVEVGPLAPDPDVLGRAFNVYLDRLETAHKVALAGLQKKPAPRSQAI